MRESCGLRIAYVRVYTHFYFTCVKSISSIDFLGSRDLRMILQFYSVLLDLPRLVRLEKYTLFLVTLVFKRTKDYQSRRTVHTGVQDATMCSRKYQLSDGE